MVDFDQSATTVKEERNKSSLLNESDKLLRFISVELIIVEELTKKL